MANTGSLCFDNVKIRIGQNIFLCCLILIVCGCSNRWRRSNDFNMLKEGIDYTITSEVYPDAYSPENKPIFVWEYLGNDNERWNLVAERCAGKTNPPDTFPNPFSGSYSKLPKDRLFFPKDSVVEIYVRADNTIAVIFSVSKVARLGFFSFPPADILSKADTTNWDYSLLFNARGDTLYGGIGFVFHGDLSVLFGEKIKRKALCDTLLSHRPAP